MLIALAAAPCILVSFFAGLIDSKGKDAFRLLLMTWTYGALLVMPVLLVQYALVGLTGLHEYTSVMDAAAHALLVVAIPEECMKLACMMLLVYPRRKFENAYNAIFFMLIIAMGFACAENFYYIFWYMDLPYETSLKMAGIRALMAVPAHAILAIFMGYYVGRAQLNFVHKQRIKQWASILTGLLLAIVFHALYDFFLFTEDSIGWGAASIVLLLLGTALGIKLMLQAVRPQKNAWV